jgi:hypothetical protein
MNLIRCLAVTWLAAASWACDSGPQRSSSPPLLDSESVSGPSSAGPPASASTPGNEAAAPNSEPAGAAAPAPISQDTPSAGPEDVAGPIHALTPAASDSSGGQADVGSAGTAPVMAVPAPKPGGTFHVFLLLGQSNMAGYPKAQPADRAEDPRVRVLGFDSCAATGRQTDVWDVAAPPLHECWNDGLGPGDYFAKTLLALIPEGDSIGLVPSAISGERIEAFLKIGGTRYDRLIQRARLAQQAGGVIEGMLFHQGESNNGDPTWPGKVNTLVSDLRADLGIGDVPFLAGELLYSGGAAGHNRLVNQLPSLISNARVISADGLVQDPTDTTWHLHFDHDSQVEFGKRYAAAMIEGLGW